MLELSRRARPVEPAARNPIFDRLARPAGRLVNRLLAPAGIKVTQTTPAQPPYDLRSVTDDPIEGAYRARDRSFVIDVPLRHCRAGIRAFAFTAEAKHPDVETILACHRHDGHTYAHPPLRTDEKPRQPANAAETLGLPSTEAHAALRRARPMAAVLPWEARGPDTATAAYIGTVKAEHRKHGGPDLPEGYGGKWSEAIAALNRDRLMRVYASIRRDGYQRSDCFDGDITGHVLEAEGVSRILVLRGRHRSAALAALGYEHAPIRLSPFVIRRDDVASWPNVRSGLFTREQALAVFDRIFDGRQPRSSSRIA